MVAFLEKYCSWVAGVGGGGGMSVIVVLQMPEVSQGHLPDGC